MGPFPGQGTVSGARRRDPGTSRSAGPSSPVLAAPIGWDAGFRCPYGSPSPVSRVRSPDPGTNRPRRAWHARGPCGAYPITACVHYRFLSDARVTSLRQASDGVCSDRLHDHPADASPTARSMGFGVHIDTQTPQFGAVALVECSSGRRNDGIVASPDARRQPLIPDQPTSRTPRARAATRAGR
jgi:hypothetical protein